jgi:hypothetical protein
MHLYPQCQYYYYMMLSHFFFFFVFVTCMDDDAVVFHVRNALGLGLKDSPVLDLFLWVSWYR